MYSASVRAELAHCLADAFLSGDWDERGLISRADLALDLSAPWVPVLSRQVLAAFRHVPADRPRELAAFIDMTLARRRSTDDDRPPRPHRWLPREPAMAPRRWPVAEIASLGALAERLGLSAGELAWLADVRSLERCSADERLRNYRYAAVPRAGGLPRLIERPKERLKAIQRLLLRDALDRIPAHDAAHGFTRGRSAVTHARRHTGQIVVLRLDLEDFFNSVVAARVYGIFRTAGYPESVAHSLTGLTTNAVPPDVWSALPASPRQLIDARHRLGRRLAQPHLPQGAPSSPALANLVAFRLDRRLSGLAATFDASYSRYADDLAFSGSAGVVRCAPQLRGAVGAIAREEGFAVNERKSTVATRAGRQELCGIVVNDHPNIRRAEYDTLRAILHNAVRSGPTSQNRSGLSDFRSHLSGRIGVPPLPWTGVG